jgi:radical SAM-linked protein
MVFAKQGTARWLGHLDVMRTFERAFRRCRVPIALSHGHNPRPQIRFVFPSSVGLAARADILFADLAESEHGDDSPALPLSALNEALPSGLSVLSVATVPGEARRSALASYTAARYVARCECSPATDTAFVDSVARSLARDGALTLRRPAARTGARGSDAVSTVRIADHVISVGVCRPAGGDVLLNMVVRFGQNGTLRPADFAAAMAERIAGLELLAVERVALLTEAETRGET